MKKNVSKAKSKPRPRLQPLGEQIIESLTSLCETVEKGQPLESRFTVHTVRLELEPRAYTASQVIAIRQKLGASQTVFAQILAVTPKTLQGWEQGKPAPRIARRLLDMIDREPEPWSKLLRAGIDRKRAG